jgi:hypothetical protein
MSETVRYCAGCLRHTETDTIPKRVYNNTTIRPYELCVHCGYVYPEREAS